MKIESNNIPAGLVKKTTSETSVASEKEDKVTQDPKQTQTRMMQWFSRAGIFTSSKTSLDQEPAKIAARHQFIKAQRKIKNLENILAIALKYSQEQSSTEEIDPDWFFSFVEMAEDINAPAMQELWGKIFSVEFGTPGSFSLRTLDTLKKLTHKDAKIFKHAVGLSSRKKNENSLTILLGYHRQAHFFALLRGAKSAHLNLSKYGLTYTNLLSLMDMGLIFSSELETGELATNNSIDYRCAGETFSLQAKQSGISLNYYKFTATGTELARLVNGKSKSSYFEDLKNLLSQGFVVN